MGIEINKLTNNTFCTCDRCGRVNISNEANGVVPDKWTTGQLWLDESLEKQLQIPVVFCKKCKPDFSKSIKANEVFGGKK